MKKTRILSKFCQTSTKFDNEEWRTQSPKIVKWSRIVVSAWRNGSVLDSETKGPWFHPRMDRPIFFLGHGSSLTLNGMKKTVVDRVIRVDAEIGVLWQWHHSGVELSYFLVRVIMMQFFIISNRTIDPLQPISDMNEFVIADIRYRQIIIADIRYSGYPLWIDPL